jgi:serine/threonine protein kinase
MVKVADFGTSRFLEIAAHGTTVIGSPPYMAPEQFQGKAVFASDIYSLGITMYQMFTGVLPYETPMPQDLEKLMKGELATPPKLKNPKLPKAISDIVMKAIAADIPSRYQRASDLLEAVLAARTPAPSTIKRPWRPAPVAASAGPSEEVQEIKERLKARETEKPKFCWKCGKALPARADVCPFCSERQ